MLQQLHIQNYAIIEALDIDLSKGLTVITGETGAGKSIMLGALSLILGQRADTTVLLDKNKKCVIEGWFNIEDYHLQHFFEENDIDYQIETSVRREINAAGKTRAFLNDTPVNLTVLKDFSAQLVDLHIQHETLELMSQQFQINVLDAIALHQSIVNDYRLEYKEYKQNVSNLNALEYEYNQLMADLEYVQFQFNELEEAHIQEGEQDELEQELRVLNNAETIQKDLSQIIGAFKHQELSVESQLNELNNQITHLAKYHKEIEALQQRFNSNLYDMQDVFSDLERIEQSTSLDNEKLTAVSDRLDLIYKLQKKHNVQTCEDLLKIQEEFESKLNSINTSTSSINELKAATKKQKETLLNSANIISEKRVAASKGLANTVSKLLEEVGMPGAKLKVAVDKQNDENININGLDTVQFLFAANQGTDFKAIKKVASGGELSRLMLCVKSQIAATTALPTLIFDEIDNGISGEVAQKVGNILNELAKNHQVICITHLPQIASKGDMHLFVYKENSDGITKTQIRVLEDKERIIEIAKMLSGDKPTDAAIQNAEELLIK